MRDTTVDVRVTPWLDRQLGQVIWFLLLGKLADGNIRPLSSPFGEEGSFCARPVARMHLPEVQAKLHARAGGRSVLLNAESFRLQRGLVAMAAAHAD